MVFREKNAVVWLIAEVQSSYKQLISELKESEFSVHHVSDFAEATSMLRKLTPDIIICESYNHEIACLEFCFLIKSTGETKHVEIFIVADQPDTNFEISCFNCGAGDFIVKPFNTTVFVKRVISRFRHHVASLASYTRKGTNTTLMVDKDSFTVYLDHQIISISRKEFELLNFLASYPGKLFSRDEIFRQVWKKAGTQKDRTIDVHILRLRKKIGEDFFQTQKGIGYRFISK